VKDPLSHLAVALRKLEFTLSPEVYAAVARGKARSLTA
jgi:hypothetical protein